MGKRHELSDAQWARIEDLFPPEQGAIGHPWREHRTILNGMFWILLTGAAWRDLPERFGPWQTVFDRFTRYRREGTFEAILKRLQLALDEEGLLDFELWLVDGSSVRASRAAAGASRKRGTHKSQQTTRSAAPEEASAPSSTSSPTGRGSRSKRA
jgi:transposase